MFAAAGILDSWYRQCGSNQNPQKDAPDKLPTSGSAVSLQWNQFRCAGRCQSGVGLRVLRGDAKAFGVLTDPVSNLIETTWADLQKLHPSNLPCGVGPGKLADGFDLVREIEREPETNWPILMHGRKRFKAKSSLGKVQNLATAGVAQLDKNQSVWNCP